MIELTPQEQENRLALKNKKPLVYDKIIKLENNPVQVLDIAYDVACDLKCTHCAITTYTPKKHKLDLTILEKIIQEADEMGIAQLALSGGEPLVFPELDSIIKAMHPNKFHIKVSTHGRHLTEKMAQRLNRLGVDKVSISLDQFHGVNSLSRKEFPQSIKGMFAVKNEGMSAVLTTVVTHQNCHDPYLIELLEFATKHNVKVDVYLAKPIGQWQNNFDIMITNEDYAYLEKLHKDYPAFTIDTFPAYGVQRKCFALRGVLNLTPYGDLFPCPFMQVSMGNVFEESLKDIVERGMQIKYFNKPLSICPTGRNRSFMEKISVNSADGSFPPTWKDVFIDDFVN